jgi:hypothetical protein
MYAVQLHCKAHMLLQASTNAQHTYFTRNTKQPPKARSKDTIEPAASDTHNTTEFHTRHIAPLTIPPALHRQGCQAAPGQQTAPTSCAPRQPRCPHAGKTRCNMLVTPQHPASWLTQQQPRRLCCCCCWRRLRLALGPHKAQGLVI